MDDQLQLRPVREDDLTTLEKLTQDPETTGEFAWFGWHDPIPVADLSVTDIDWCPCREEKPGAS